MSISRSPPPDCPVIRVLLVDDEDAFRTSLAEMLAEDGHEVLAYSCPPDVPLVDVLSAVTVVITDYEMPGQDGLAFADAIHAHRSMLPVLMVSAYRTATIEAEAARRAWLSLLPKPLDYDDLHAFVHALVESSAPADL